MSRIQKLLKSLFSSPTLVLDFEDELTNLATKARTVCCTQDGDGINDFIQAVSSFQERGLVAAMIREYESYDYGQHTKTISCLRDLQEQVKMACNLSAKDFVVNEQARKIAVLRAGSIAMFLDCLLAAAHGKKLLDGHSDFLRKIR